MLSKGDCYVMVSLRDFYYYLDSAFSPGASSTLFKFLGAQTLISGLSWLKYRESKKKCLTTLSVVILSENCNFLLSTWGNQYEKTLKVRVMFLDSTFCNPLRPLIKPCEPENLNKVLQAQLIICWIQIILSLSLILCISSLKKNHYNPTNASPN